MTDRSNPWLETPAASERGASVEVVSTDPVPATGPEHPQPAGVPAPDQVDQLPVVRRTETPMLWVLGAHGGAGESSLAALMKSWRAAEHAWPAPPQGAPKAPVVLVARTNAAGLLAARSAATQWAAGLAPEVKLVGLVLIADAPGRLPKPLRDLARVVAGGVPRRWTVPWIEPWRLGEPLSLPDSPRSIQRVVRQINALTNPDLGATAEVTTREESR